MFQGFKKATPYGGARKLRLTQPPVRSAHPLAKGDHESRSILFVSYENVSFFESLKHAKQDLSIIEFENQV